MGKRDFEGGVFGDTLRSDRDAADRAKHPSKGGGARSVLEEEGEGFESLVSRNRSGKQLLTVPEGAQVMAPAMIPGGAETALVAAVSSDGHLLVFPLGELPELDKGKGNKIINLPSSKHAAGARLIALAAFQPTQDLVVVAGGRITRLKGHDLDAYRGTRAQRGALLPRGLQRVDRLEVV